MPSGFILGAVGSFTLLQPLKSGYGFIRSDFYPDRKQVVLSGLLPPQRVLLVPANYWYAPYGEPISTYGVWRAPDNRRLPSDKSGYDPCGVEDNSRHIADYCCHQATDRTPVRVEGT